MVYVPLYLQLRVWWKYKIYDGMLSHNLASAHNPFPFPEEYNPFVIQVYGSTELPSLCNVEAIFYVEEAKLEKFKNEIKKKKAL